MRVLVGVLEAGESVVLEVEWKVILEEVPTGGEW